MSSSLESAFNYACSLKAIKCDFIRPLATDVMIEVYVTPSNYGRKENSVEEAVTYGREYLIPYKFFAGTAISGPRRGDIIQGTYLKSETIGEVIELYNLGGSLFGFRVRTE